MSSRNRRHLVDLMALPGLTCPAAAQSAADDISAKSEAASAPIMFDPTSPTHRHDPMILGGFIKHFREADRRGLCRAWFTAGRYTGLPS